MDLQNIIIINGNEFSFEPGESILDIARRNSIDIPTLCHLKEATPTGACRVCVVEVEGRPQSGRFLCCPGCQQYGRAHRVGQSHRRPAHGHPVVAFIRQSQLCGERICRPKLDRISDESAAD